MMLLFRRLAVLSIAVFCAVAYSSQPDSYSPLRAEPALSLAVISDTHIDIINSLVVKIKIATFNTVEAGDHAKQGCFAAAGRSQQGKKLLIVNI